MDFSQLAGAVAKGADYAAQSPTIALFISFLLSYLCRKPLTKWLFGLIKAAVSEGCDDAFQKYLNPPKTPPRVNGTDRKEA